MFRRTPVVFAISVVIVLASGGAAQAKSCNATCRLQKQVATLSTKVSALQSSNRTLTGDVSALQSSNTTLSGDVSALRSSNTMLSGDVSALQSSNTMLTGDVSVLQGSNTQLQTLLAGVTRPSSNRLLFKGVNVQIESTTDPANGGSLDGSGNLIVGYNDSPGTQTGSDNLVVGSDQSFTSYGGIVAGYTNSISGPYASATGGGHNKASGSNSSVTGGEYNLASDPFASIAGGCDNLAGTGTAPSGTCNSSGLESILGGANETLSTPYDSQAGSTVFTPGTPVCQDSDNDGDQNNGGSDDGDGCI